MSLISGSYSLVPTVEDISDLKTGMVENEAICDRSEVAGFRAATDGLFEMFLTEQDVKEAQILLPGFAKCKFLSRDDIAVQLILRVCSVNFNSPAIERRKN